MRSHYECSSALPPLHADGRQQSFACMAKLHVLPYQTFLLRQREGLKN